MSAEDELMSPEKSRALGTDGSTRQHVVVDASQTTAARPQRQFRGLVAFELERFSLVLAWIVIIVIFGILSPSVFLTSSNFSGIFGSQAVLVILTLGLLILLTAGDYDLSIGSVLGLGAMSTAILNVNDHWPLVLAVLVGVAAGMAVGLVNGLAAGLLGLDPFIVTLGTGTLVSGIIYWISNSNTITGVSPALSTIVVTTRFLGVPLEFYYAIALALILWYVFEYIPLGRRLLFVGKNRNVARLNGLHVNRLRFGALIASATVSAVAGVAFVGTTGGADPNSSASFLLPSYAAAFLGATAIKPGRFNPFGAVIAVYFLVTGISGLEILGAQSYIQDLFYGGALVIAVGVSTFVRRRGVNA